MSRSTWWVRPLGAIATNRGRPRIQGSPSQQGSALSRGSENGRWEKFKGWKRQWKSRSGINKVVNDSSCVRQSHPDEVVGEVVVVGVGAGCEVEASVSSATAPPLQACTLTMLIKNSRLADCSGKGSWACAKCLFSLLCAHKMDVSNMQSRVLRANLPSCPSLRVKHHLLTFDKKSWGCGHICRCPRPWYLELGRRNGARYASRQEVRIFWVCRTGWT